MADEITAAVILIGNEILSGRTQDVNLSFLAGRINELGIEVKEARIISDNEIEIVDAVNFLRTRYDYIFTTGGIGPTHDDITPDSVAKAFGVGLNYHPKVYPILKSYFEENGYDANEARMRMARIPDTATLIDNSVSLAPGFQIENVFVLAGVPKIAQAMFDGASKRLRRGAKILSRSIRCHSGEGTVAEALKALQMTFPDVDMGSYPWSENGVYGTTLVLRSKDSSLLNSAYDLVFEMVSSLGGTPSDETSS